MKLEENRYVETYKNVTADVLYRYEDGTPAILSKAYGKGNISTGSKAFIMSLCDKLGIKKNICSAKDVKISLSETDTEAMIIAINSASGRRSGVISLNRDYAEAEVVYGNCEVQVNGSELKFTLEADKSAVLRLKVVS